MITQSIIDAFLGCVVGKYFTFITVTNAEITPICRCLSTGSGSFLSDKMEKIFKTIGKALNTGMGIDFFGSRGPTKVSSYLKTFVCLLIHVLSLILQTCFLVFGLNESAIEKFFLYCTLPGTGAIFIQFLQLWWNKQRFCEFIDWVRSRYLQREPMLVDDLSRSYFQPCPVKLRKYSV